ncbi:FecCD family ABC transporter permease [Pseudalkalibacillus decolorationis]|uniref:FecCD family ABC transporter permease n=1 Tax=Pseudalkalibacillus decolorationis TaxID=163879 RepID=UPI002148BD15|nr:iron ABC transporter permease [Pseudalkalibacillus decolorationis]
MASIQTKNSYQVRARPKAAAAILLIGLMAIILAMAASIMIGVREISLSTLWHSLFSFNPEDELHEIIRSIRLPRVLAGALVGAGFAVAGAMMQGMTRNGLADPGLLGVNAGSGFVLVLVFAFFPKLPFEAMIIFSFIGAALGAGLVYGVAFFAKGGLSPVRLVLAGAVIGSLLTGLSQAITLLYQITYDLTFWSAGGVSTADWLQVSVMAPWIAGGIIAAFILSRFITILSLGEEIAIGLGQRTKLIRGLATLIVLILSGAAVSTVGGVGFIGLIVPHIVRYLVGVDYRWIIPCSAVIGALLVVLADIGAKTVNMPYETPLGSIIAVIGIPFFLYLARKERRELA